MTYENVEGAEAIRLVSAADNVFVSLKGINVKLSKGNLINAIKASSLKGDLFSFDRVGSFDLLVKST